jgi:hypothetical protein
MRFAPISTEVTKGLDNIHRKSMSQCRRELPSDCDTLSAKHAITAYQLDESV